MLHPEEEAPPPFHFLAFVKEYVSEGLGTSLWRRETVCLLGTFPTERLAFWQRSRCQVKRSRSINASGSACWARTGCLSLIPDASDGEAKAAHLSRYAEVRWSPDVTTSLRLLAGGS